MRFLFLSIFIFNFTILNAQVILSHDFKQQLNKAEIKFHPPTDEDFETLALHKKDYQKVDLTLNSKQGDLEIRYLIIPFTATPQDELPHIMHLRMATHLASNEDDAPDIQGSALSHSTLPYFSADAGYVFDFRPKKNFSEKKHCKMMSLFKSNRANFYIFYLYDKSSEELERQFLPIQFK